MNIFVLHEASNGRKQTNDLSYLCGFLSANDCAGRTMILTFTF